MSKLILRKTLVRISEAVVALCLLLPALSMQAVAAPMISVSGTVTSQVDGEPLEGSTFEITSVPAVLEVLVPNSSQWNPNPTKVDRPSVTDGLLGTKLADKLRNSNQG